MALKTSSNIYYKIKLEETDKDVVTFDTYSSEDARKFEKETENEWALFTHNAKKEIDYLSQLTGGEIIKNASAMRKQLDAMLILPGFKGNEARYEDLFRSDDSIEEDLEEFFNIEHTHEALSYVFSLRDALECAEESRFGGKELTDSQVEALQRFGYKKEWQNKHIIRWNVTQTMHGLPSKEEAGQTAEEKLTSYYIGVKQNLEDVIDA